MSAPRGTETSNLVNVIDVLQLGRKTGVLTVEREVNGHMELGEITFTNGKITQARSNHYSREDGIAALQWLRTWGACLFLFETHQEEERITRPLPAASHEIGRRDTKPHHIPASGEAERDSFSVVPQRIIYLEKALHLIDNAQLSRTHRQLFLLIDGQRNVGELLRLLGRRQDEGLKLLRDLAYIGVIR